MPLRVLGALVLALLDKVHGLLVAVILDELDHVDAIRQFGILWFIAFSLIAGYIALRFVKSRNANNRALGMAFISIYLAAGTNPVLITPLFMMLFATLYTKMKHDTRPLLSKAIVRSLLSPQPL